MSSAPFKIKQGGVLSLAFQVVQDDGTPVDITGAVLFSEVRDQFGALIATPVLALTTPTLGQFRYTAASDATWPHGRVRTDIYINFGDTPFYTDTFFVDVSAPVSALADLPP